MLLMTGSGGQLGRLIAARLNEYQIPFQAGSHRPQEGQRPVDFDQPALLNFQGIKTLLLISAGYGEDDEVTRRHGHVIAAAQRDGVQHVVYTSLTGDGDHLAFALAHRWTERKLQESGLNYTILRNGLYSELIGELTRPENNVITTPLGDGKIAAVARTDLADAAVKVIASPHQHIGKTYELVGTRPVGGREIAATRHAIYRPETLGETRTRLTTPLLLPFQPPMLLSIFSAIAGGFMEQTTRSDLPRLLGREPRDPLTSLD